MMVLALFCFSSFLPEGRQGLGQGCGAVCVRRWWDTGLGSGNLNLIHQSQPETQNFTHSLTTVIKVLAESAFRPLVVLRM